jgi:CheY-like chemotaxis protein
MKKFKNILLIDDDYTSNVIVETELKSSSLAENVVIAHHGEEGLHMIKRFCSDGKISCFDLIILDITMPVMDGIEFLQELDAIGLESKPNIIVLTSSHNPSLMEKVNEFNVNGLINKPFNVGKLNLILQYLN